MKVNYREIYINLVGERDMLYSMCEKRLWKVGDGLNV